MTRVTERDMGNMGHSQLHRNMKLIEDWKKLSILPIIL